MKENLEVARELLVSEVLIHDIWEMIHQESLRIEK
jgi:hypothetical protein